MGLIHAAAILSLKTEKKFGTTTIDLAAKKKKHESEAIRQSYTPSGKNGPRVTKAHYSTRPMRSGSHGPRDRPDRGPLIHLGYITEVN